MIHPRKREFLALTKQTGWSQAELARRLELTPGGVSGLVKGGTVPSAGLVKLLRLVISSDLPGTKQPAARSFATVSEAREPGLDKLLESLARLAPRERGELLTQFAGIAKLVSRRRASSGADGAAQREFRGAASASAGAAALSSGRQSQPASGAGSTTSAASGKKRGAPRHQVA